MAVVKAVGLKQQDPEEYVYQAFKFKQDANYFTQLIAEVAALVKQAETFGSEASYFWFCADVNTHSYVRLKHAAFPEIASLLAHYPKLTLDAQHTVFQLPNLAWEKAVQKCIAATKRYPTNACQGVGKIKVSTTALSSRIFTFNLDPSGLVFIPVQLRPISNTALA